MYISAAHPHVQLPVYTLIPGSHKCQSSRLNYLSFTGWYWICNDQNMFVYILYISNCKNNVYDIEIIF